MSQGETVQRAASEAICERIRALEGTGMRTFSDPDPLVWARTEGCRVWDADGRPYLDLYAGFAVAAVGYCHPRVTEAICAQASSMTHCPSAAPSQIRAELYERLTRIAPPGLDRVLLGVTGGMANEMAVQLARAATGRSGVIAFSGSYFGRTVGSVRFAGKHAYRSQLGVSGDAQFFPFPDRFHSPWGEAVDVGEAVLALLEQSLSDPGSGIEPPACIIVEPIQGNAGVVIPPDGFLTGLRKLCDSTGALLVFDEIQCGFGRSGRMWACDHEGVVPDLLTMGKGIGGGLVISALVGRESLMTTWKSDAVTSTFLTNSLTAAASCAAIDVHHEFNLVQRSAELGAIALARLEGGLKDHPNVGEVRGRGLFIGLELVDGSAGKAPDSSRAGQIVRALRERGVLVGRGGRFGNVIKLSPPLVIDRHELEQGIETILEVFL